MYNIPIATQIIEILLGIKNICTDLDIDLFICKLLKLYSLNWENLALFK